MVNIYCLEVRDKYLNIQQSLLLGNADLFVTLTGYEVDSIHEAADPVQAVRQAEGIFIGEN